MSSAGQIIGGVAGAAIGFFVGNPVLGAQIGMMVGGAIDPPKGPHIEGPRLTDLKVQTSTYGATKPRAYGTVMLSGNVFWLEGDQLKEVTTTEEQGGKGGGGQEVTKYSYYATFAVGLCKGPVYAIRRLWIGDELVYSAVTGSDAGVSNAQLVENMLSGAFEIGTQFTLFNGSDTQAPCARMQADKGAANVSGYPGEAWLLIEDMNLEKWSNTLVRAQVKAEVVIDATASITDTEIAKFPKYNESSGYGGFPWALNRSIWAANFDDTGVTIISWLCRDPDGYSVAIEFERQEFPYSKTVATREIDRYAMGGGTFNWFGNYVMCQSDEDLLITAQGHTGYPNDYTLGFHRRGESIWSPQVFTYAGFPANAALAIAANGRYFVAGSKIHEININGIVQSSPSVSVYWMGASTNYLFTLSSNTMGLGTTVVNKFSLNDLSLVATYSQTTYGQCSLKVIDDNTFYTTGYSASGNHVYKWVGGVVVSDTLSGTSSSIPARAFNIIGNTPPQLVYAQNFVSFSGSPPPSIRAAISSVDDTPAKLRDIITKECELAGVSSGDIDLLSLTNSDVRGLTIATVSAVRSAFEPLRAAFWFDVCQSGYKVKFISRGSASIATIAESELGATTNQAEPLLIISREMASQLPCSVAVTYFNSSREYEVDEQYAERLNSGSLNERRVELALVLTSTEAAQIADVLLKNDWIGRTQLGPFYLPPPRANLEPCDVITVLHRGALYECRLTSIEYMPDGSLKCFAVSTASTTYASSAVGAASSVASSLMVPLRGFSELLLLDIPRIVSDQDVPGLVAGLYGGASGWPGGTIFKSDDFGNAYSTVASFLNGTKTFTASGTIGSATSTMVDSASVLTVTPAWSGAELFSITDAQLFSGSNVAAYGAPGRWEIIAFKTVVNNSGTYTLSDFVRGRFGSEWAMTLHQAGDLLVMLDINALNFISLPTAAINSPRLWRGVTAGQSLDSAAEISYTPIAESLECWSPVHLTGNRNPSSYDWTITATPRSRWPVEPFSGLSTPNSESISSYSLEIWDSGYATLKRTLTSSTASFTYPLADQVTDFGAKQPTLYLKASAASAIMGAGHILQSSLVRNVSDDPYASYVVLAMHMDGTNGSTTFIDLIGNTITPYSTTISTAYGIGGASALFNGTSSRLAIPYSSSFDFGTGPFTIEFDFYLAATTFPQTFYSRASGENGIYSETALSITTTTNIQFYYGVRGTSSVNKDFTLPITLTTGTKYHLEFNRDALGVVRLAINGVFSSTTHTITTNISGTLPLNIGCFYYSTGIQWFNGYIDELRFTNGICRNTANYTAPVTAFPNP